LEGIKVHKKHRSTKKSVSLISISNKNNFTNAVGLAKSMNKGNSYKHSNFLLAEKAIELEVEIIWTENNEGRPLKETFIFTE
jgi:lambda repressor-like predicted transcriptional regulator